MAENEPLITGHLNQLFVLKKMLKDNKDIAELVVTTFFKIEELKHVLRVENNIDLVDFLESYNHLNHMLNQAMNLNNKDLAIEKMEQTVAYIKRLLDISAHNECRACNINIAIGMLKEIRQRLQLLNTMVESESDHKLTAKK